MQEDIRMARWEVPEEGTRRSFQEGLVAELRTVTRCQASDVVRDKPVEPILAPQGLKRPKWQVDMKCGADAQFALDRNFAVVCVHHVFHNLRS